MDQQQFDALLKRLAVEPRPRRSALLLLAGGVLGGLVARAGPGAAAATGCAKVGKPCKRATHCCSGICTGKHGKKKCRGHGAGTCQRGQDICTDPNPDLDRCNNNALCACIVTTAGTSFCYDQTFGGGNWCADCERDTDCVGLGFPTGSACGPVSAGRCAGLCESSTACLAPCGTAP